MAVLASIPKVYDSDIVTGKSSAINPVVKSTPKTSGVSVTVNSPTIAKVAPLPPVPSPGVVTSSGSTTLNSSGAASGPASVTATTGRVSIGQFAGANSAGGTAAATATTTVNSPASSSADPYAGLEQLLAETGTNAYGPGGVDESGTSAPASTAGLQDIQPTADDTSTTTSSSGTSDETIGIIAVVLVVVGVIGYFMWKHHKATGKWL
jgi:hypothetical protein